MYLSEETIKEEMRSKFDKYIIPLPDDSLILIGITAKKYKKKPGQFLGVRLELFYNMYADEFPNIQEMRAKDEVMNFGHKLLLDYFESKGVFK